MSEARCNICHNGFGEPIYHVKGLAGLTSLNSSHDQETIVWFCESCGHTMTKPLADIGAFYDEQYGINIDSDDDDQLMKVENGRNIFRTDYQKDTLFQKIDIPRGAAVLDFGAAKALTLQKIYRDRPDIIPHVFDVSEDYRHFWDKHFQPENTATYAIPESWDGRFDLIISFFVMEHVADPLERLATQHRLLKEGGRIYFVIPNLHDNPADLLVADHINHFSPTSLELALAKTGFTHVDIDDAINPFWFVVTAVKTAQTVNLPRPSPERIRELGDKSREIAGYWLKMMERVAAFADEIPAHEPIAVYGAGFYGTFIGRHMTRPEQIRYYIDRNPHLHGKDHLGKPVIAPEALPPEITHVLVGLNPRIAENAMGEVVAWKNRPLQYYYLF